jgi:hypothetical protein
VLLFHAEEDGRMTGIELRAKALAGNYPTSAMINPPSTIWRAAHGFGSNRVPCRDYRLAYEAPPQILGRQNSELRPLWQEVPGVPSWQVAPAPGAPSKDYLRLASPTVHTRKRKQVLRRPRSNQVMISALVFLLTRFNADRMGRLPNGKCAAGESTREPNFTRTAFEAKGTWAGQVAAWVGSQLPNGQWQTARAVITFLQSVRK